MSTNAINTNKQTETFETKQEILDYKLKEYTADEEIYTIKYTFSEFIYHQRAKCNAQATIDYYKRFYAKFEKFLNDIMNDTPDNIPTAAMIKFPLQGLFVAYLQNTNGGVNQQTVNNYLRAYRSYGNYCQEVGYIQGFKCPIKEVKPAIKDVYTQEEIDKLLVKPNKKDFEQYRNYNIISLLCATGARRNTIVNIKVSDVDLKTGCITLNTTKTHCPVILPLQRKALRDIREYIMYSEALFESCGCEFEYLFPNRYGEQLTNGALSKSIAKYNKSRGVDKTSIHLFRHTFAKRWILNGGDICELQKMLTHSELNMVVHYSNLYGMDLTDAVTDAELLFLLE